MLKKYLAPLVLAFIIILNLSLGFARLGNYSAVDEPYWTYGRTSKFWNAIAQHKWKSTNINDKPGITVAILSGAGLLKYDPMKYEGIRGDPKTADQIKDIDGINFYFRLPIFLFATFSLLGFYFLLKKLFDQTTALLASIFIGLSPILLGISLIINPDSLLWIFLPLSLLSYLVFQKEQNKKYLAYAGILLGLSLLTKYVANLLYIFFFALPFLEYILAKEKPALKNFLQKSAKDYALLVAISMATFYFLFPAAWAHPKVLLEGTFLSKAFVKTWPIFVGLISLLVLDTLLLKNKILKPMLDFFSKNQRVLIFSLGAIFLSLVVLAFLNTYLGMKPFNLEGILSSPKGIGLGEFSLSRVVLGAMLANMYSLIFGLHPLVLFFLLVGISSLFKKETASDQASKTILYFAFFILLYYLASTANDVIATVRYQIILYPLAFVIAGLGAKQLLEKSQLKKYLPLVWLLPTLIASLTISILNIKPFYFTYASALLPNQYLLNTKDMGDGSFEAAAYLNSLPNAHEITVWSDKGAVCTEFVGTCNIGFSKKDLLGKKFDYFVISAGRVNRSLKLSGSANDIVNFKKIYSSTQTAEKEIIIGGRANDFVKIISANAI